MNNIKNVQKITFKCFQFTDFTYQDNHLLIVNKRIGDIVQGDKTNDKPLSEIAKEYIKNKFNKNRKCIFGCNP